LPYDIMRKIIDKTMRKKKKKEKEKEKRKKRREA
jgi:hypothetical protein